MFRRPRKVAFGKGQLLLAAFAFAMLGGSPSAGAALSFGARTQFWPFMFVHGDGRVESLSADERAKFDTAIGNLGQYAALGAEWNIVDVWQEIDGPDGFRRLDRVFREHENRGIQVALRLLETPEIYDEIRLGGERQEHAVRGYQNWLRAIVKRYGIRVRYYLISNEVDHDIGYNRPTYKPFRLIEFDEYATLLKAAYAEIHLFDRRPVVMDHGVSTYSLAMAFVADLVARGRLMEAQQVWASMEYESPGESARTLPRLLATLQGEGTRRRIAFARRTVTSLAQYRDAFQLHHYMGPKMVPALMQWLQSAIPDGSKRVVVATEVGYTGPAAIGKSWDGRQVNIADKSRYSEIAHGNSIAKTITGLAAAGVSDILYWQIRFHMDHHGPVMSLYADTSDRDRFNQSYPAQVFRNLAEKLKGARPVFVSGSGRNLGTLEYRFLGTGEWSILWREDGAPVALTADEQQRASSAHDLAGTSLPMTIDGSVNHNGPIIVSWRTLTR